jgi:paraquat-inducible protein B
MIATADNLLKSNVTGTLDQVNTTLEELRRPLATADAVLKNADATLMGKDAPLQQDLRDTLQEVIKAVRSLRIFLDYLDQHPESLLRGKTEVKP